MSKDLSSEPWHRKYRKARWYSLELQLPHGRDPHRDLFSNEIMAKVMKVVGEVDDSKVPLIQSELRNIAEDYLVVVFNTPLAMHDSPGDVNLSRRVRWLERQLISPTEQILDAVKSENRHMLSEWPDQITAAAPEIEVIVDQLSKMHARVSELRITLLDRIDVKANHTREFQYDLVVALLELYRRHFPGKRSSRGIYDRALGEFIGPFPIFLRLCFKEIFPFDTEISDYVIERALRKPNP